MILLNASDYSIVPVKNSCINAKIFTEKGVNFHSKSYLFFRSENGPLYTSSYNKVAARSPSFIPVSQMHGDDV